jgi:hypothetical protein
VILGAYFIRRESKMKRLSLLLHSFLKGGGISAKVQKKCAIIKLWCKFSCTLNSILQEQDTKSLWENNKSISKFIYTQSCER